MSAALSQVFAPTSTEAARYHAILDRKIREGAAAAAALFETIQNDVPKDVIASTRKVAFVAGESNVEIVVGDDRLTPTSFALGQVAERAGVPFSYLGKLATAEEPWRRELAADLLARHYTNGDAERVLVRSVRGQARGWLSDRFRRLDSRPLLDALIGEVQALGAVPYAGVATDTRVALKVLLPEILEPIPGDYVVRGGEWSNSDYGNGTHSFRGFVLRVACLNGMTRENMLRQIHLGAKLSDDVQFSERTYALDTRASTSALKDVVRHALGPASKDNILSEIRRAHEKEFSARSLQAAVKSVGKATAKSIVDAFESEDIINLPAGNTAWRASNAISWIARHTESTEDRLDLERLAGTVVPPAK